MYHVKHNHFLCPQSFLRIILYRWLKLMFNVTSPAYALLLEKLPFKRQEKLFILKSPDYTAKIPCAYVESFHAGRCAFHFMKFLAVPFSQPSFALHPVLFRVLVI